MSPCTARICRNASRRTTFSQALALVAILALLPMPCSGAPDMDFELDGALERIEYLELALAEQRESLEACRLTMVGVLNAYTVARTSGDGNHASERDSEYAALRRLRHRHVLRLIDTMQKLAANFDTASDHEQRLNLHSDALEHVSRAAELWNEVGELLDLEGAAAFRMLDFDPAGGLHERASTAFSEAEQRWRRASGLLRALDATTGTEATEARRGACRNKAIAALRAALDAYFNAYQVHKEQAGTRQSDIHRLDAGEDWRRTAAAQQSWERVTLRVHELEATP